MNPGTRPPEPLDDALFAALDPPQLMGSRCTSCKTVVFPSARSCPRCSSPDVTPHPLPTSGRLWSYTVQTFPPKPPFVVPDEGFSAFPVGYVDLGDVLVESVLVADPVELRIGLDVRLTLHPVQTAAGPALGYAFSAGSRWPS